VLILMSSALVREHHVCRNLSRAAEDLVGHSQLHLLLEVLDLLWRMGLGPQEYLKGHRKNYSGYAALVIGHDPGFVLDVEEAHGHKGSQRKEAHWLAALCGHFGHQSYGCLRSR